MADKKKTNSELSNEVAGLRRKIAALEEIERKCLQERILLRTLINNLPDAIYAKDASCRKTIANPADVHNMGLQSETDVLGKDDFELFPKDVAEGFFADDQSVIQSGKAVLNREEYFVDGEGKKHWLMTSKLPLKDEGGKIVGLIGIGRDITERKNAEEALRHEKAFMDALMDSVPDSIYFKDRQCRLTKINRKMMNDLKFEDMNQVIGKTDVDLFGEEFGRKTLESELHLMAIGKPIVGLTESRQLADGSIYWTSATKVPMRNDNGQIVGLVGITREINEFMKVQEEREHERHLLRTLIDNLPDGIYAKDSSCRKTLANPADVHNMGLQSEAEVLGKDDFEFFPKNIAEGFFADDQSVIQSGTPVLNREEYFIDGEGRKRWLLTSKLPLKNNHDEIIGIIGVSRDITERKQAEEQVRSQMSIIENQNLELEKARDAAMEANKTKSAFLASMSHELRTPLNAIIGYSEMIIEEMSDAGETSYRGDLDRIRTAGKNLLELINEVLDLSKIEAGKMELYVEEFQLSSLIDEVVSTVQPLTEKNENSLLVNIAKDIPTVRLDHTKVRQILFNLISNASKFTQKGTITLSAAAIPPADHPGTKIALKVSDTGIGLTEEQKLKLFKEFSQADSSTTRKYGGTGLGLAITKHFTEMMHGSIEIESATNRGTTFTVTLPQSIENTGEKKAPAIAPAEKTPAPLPTNTAVLVVDDDPGVRDLLLRYLSKEGYLVECVASGDEGIKRAKEILPMAIILDVMMPRKDGWAVLQEIKNDPTLKSIPVVMYTMLDEKNFGLAIGASEYLIKPVSKEKILQVLEKYKQRAPSEYILIVDDNPDLRTMASRAIQKAGWEVRTAENGKSALALLEIILPSIIFLDIMMPVMDGFEFLSIFQNREEWKHIPVVVITSKDLMAEERQQLNGVVKKVIQKGDFTPEKLLKQISFLIPQLTTQNISLIGAANG